MVGTGKAVPLTDIVVYSFIKSIIKNIPNTYPDYLLRTSYSDLFTWYMDKDRTIAEEIEERRKEGVRLFEENKVEDPYKNELDSYINVNGKWFTLSVLVAAAIYAFFENNDV